VRPLSVPEYRYWEDRPIPVIAVRQRMRWWVRGGLVIIALGILLVFSVALHLDPNRDSKVWTEETHRQLGLPQCTFRFVTGMPCPSCGMTTSFAHLVRGDVWDSMRANFAGTFLAVVCLVYLPWTLISVWRGRYLWFASLEDTFLRLLIVFMFLMLGRWVIVLALHLWLHS
jgi:hypothetical protein